MEHELVDNEHWHFRPTGDITLAVISSTDERILSVDMLSYQTMKAGDHGERLAKTCNNLSFLAGIPESLRTQEVSTAGLPHPEAGLSPLPWTVSASIGKRRVSIKDRDGRRIADHVFPKKVPKERMEQIVAVLLAGVYMLNRWNEDGCSL